MSERIYKHQCKECDTRFYIEELSIVSIASCPKCSSECIYVDEHKLERNSKNSQDEFDALAYGLRKAGIDFGNSKTSLLVIELENETTEPKVFYDGKEITGKIRVSFNWETRTDEYGGTRYNIEHFDNEYKVPTIKSYGLARGKYAVSGND